MSELTLHFDLTQCSRCHGQRLQARWCPECGAAPEAHETQTDLRRRERLVREFRSGRLSPEIGNQTDIRALQKRFDRSQKAVLTTLGRAAKNSRSADELIRAFAVFDQVIADFQTCWPRPARNLGKTYGRSTAKFASGVELLIEALVAKDILSAQQLVDASNVFFHEAEELLAEAKDIFRAFSIFEEHGASNNGSILARSALKHLGRGKSIRELDKNLSNATGWNIDAEGMGLSSHLLHEAALVMFDIEIFTQILEESRSITTRIGAELVLSEQWRRSHARATALLTSTIASLGGTLQIQGASDFEVVYRLVESIATLRDGILKHSLATLLSSSVDDYQSLMQGKGGLVIKAAAARFPLLLLNENLTPAFRHAGAHADVDLDGDDVIVGGEAFAAAQFMDKVLAYQETVISIFQGVVLGVAHLGFEPDTDSYQSERDRDAAVSLMFGLFGLTLEDAEIDHDLVTLRARGEMPDWLSLAASLSNIYPSSILELTVHVANSVEGEHHCLTALLKPFRARFDRVSDVDEVETALDFAAVVAGSRLDGGSLWSGEMWTKVSDLVCRRDDARDLRDWSRAVRALRGIAHDAAMADVEQKCIRALSALRK